MTDGEFGPLYVEVRNLNNLSATDIDNTILDQHLKEAFYEVQSALKIDFVTSATAMTDITFNTKDLYVGNNKTILYLNDFKDKVSGIYLPLLTITSLSYKTMDTGDWEEQDEGQEKDYTIDLIRNAIRFNYKLQSNGYENLKFTGTGGLVYSPMTDMIEKYKKYIALIAAIKGISYASGGTFDDVKSGTGGSISFSTGEFQVNYNSQLKQLKEQLEAHKKAYGLSKSRSNTRII